MLHEVRDLVEFPLRNITIALGDDLAAWLRVAAAREGKSVSRYLGDKLERERAAENDRDAALRTLDKFLSGPGYPGLSQRLPTREELYAEREEELLSRYERARLRAGSGRTGETTHSHGFAEGDGKAGDSSPQPPEPE